MEFARKAVGSPVQEQVCSDLSFLDISLYCVQETQTKEGKWIENPPFGYKIIAFPKNQSSGLVLIYKSHWEKYIIKAKQTNENHLKVLGILKIQLNSKVSKIWSSIHPQLQFSR